MNKINTKRVLSSFAMIILTALIVQPFIPEISYRTKGLQSLDDTEVSQILENTKQSSSSIITLDNAKELSSVNYVVIPKIGVIMPIVEGNSDSVLNGGNAWRRPNTAKPGEKANSVITAHRFEWFQGERTFYHLDKLKTGDEIFVRYNDRTFAYKVNNSFVVHESQTEIEAPTNFEQLTLYTCTPLWTSENRLVVTALPA